MSIQQARTVCVILLVFNAGLLAADIVARESLWLTFVQVLTVILSLLILVRANSAVRRLERLERARERLRETLDALWYQAEDRALLDSAELQESLEQMRQGFFGPAYTDEELEQMRKEEDHE